MAGTGTAHLRSDALLRVDQLNVEFPVGRGATVKAVSGISIDVIEGETLGLVGESGCGKSTTGRAIMQLPKPTSGEVLFDGPDLTKLRGEELRTPRTPPTMIFHDPISYTNPPRRLRAIIPPPLKLWGVARHSAP